MAVRGVVADQGDLFFRMLGQLTVERVGESVDVGSPQTRALLAQLLLRRREFVSTDRLIEDLWPSGAPRHARVQVQGYISSLRRSLAFGRECAIQTGTSGYCLQVPGHVVDLDVFQDEVRRAEALLGQGHTSAAAEQLHRALGRWHGEALADVDLPVVRQAAAHLEELRLAAIQLRVDTDLAIGSAESIIPELTQLVAAHPLREPLRGQLMTALARCGRVPEALECYRQGREQLVDLLGVEPSAALRRIHVGILRGEPGLTPEAGGMAAAGHVIPRQLPIGLADFTNRQALLDMLVAELSPVRRRSVPPLIAISGPGGVGKTAFAIHLAHALSDSYPDGQLFIELNGIRPAPVSTHTGLGRLLKALGVPPGALPDGVQERAELYRSRLHGRRMLLVLDDVGDEAQLRALLPAEGGCAVLVTSRRRLAGVDNATPVPLDVLSEADSVALIGRILRDDRAAVTDATAELARQCGGLPLALRVTAARMRHHPHWTSADLAEQMRDERSRLDWMEAGDVSVRASIGLGYRQLGAPQQRLFRLLGLLESADFPSWVAAALLDEDYGTARRVLDDLVGCHLVEATGRGMTGPRFRMHDLVHLVARELADDIDPREATAAARRRVIAGWLGSADRANGALRRYPTETIVALDWQPPAAVLEAARADPVAWFADESAALIGAVHQAVRAGHIDLAWPLTQRICGYLDLNGRLQEQQNLIDLGLAAARAAGDRQGTAAMLRMLAELHDVRGDLAAAWAAAESATEAYATLGSEWGMACLLRVKMGVARAKGDLTASAAFGERMVEIAERVADPMLLMDALTGLSTTLIFQGRPAQARLLQERAVGVDAGELNHARALYLLASSCSETDDLAEAERLLQQSRATLQRLRATRPLAFTELRLALLRNQSGNGQEAETLARHALETFHMAGQLGAKGRALDALGDALLLQGMPMVAADHFRAALAVWRSIGAQQYLAGTLRSLIALHQEAGDTDVVTVYDHELELLGLPRLTNS